MRIADSTLFITGGVLRRMLVNALVLCASFALASQAHADASPAPREGFLCCTLRTDGSWISDLAYADEGLTLVPAGTPVKVTGFGRQRVHIEINGAKQDIGNDYSRSLELPDFAKRYVVPSDPVAQLEGAPPELLTAIRNGKVLAGMTREQVVMALGYPVTKYNPNLAAKQWLYYVSGDREYKVVFDDSGKLDHVEGDANVVAFVQPPPGATVSLTWQEKPCALNVYRASTRNMNERTFNRPHLFVDDKDMAVLGVGDSQCLDLAPGVHQVALRSSLLGVLTPGDKIEVTVSAGTPVFVRYGDFISGIGLIGKQVMMNTGHVLQQVAEPQWRERL